LTLFMITTCEHMLHLSQIFIVVYTLVTNWRASRLYFYRCICLYLGPGIPEGHTPCVTLLTGSSWAAPSSFLGRHGQQTGDYCTLEYGCHIAQGDMHCADVDSVELRPEGSPLTVFVHYHKLGLARSISDLSFSSCSLARLSC